jgi:tetratricopeptide (TPR) repeat protein
LSKVNAIRKKALEYVRNQDWPSATKEYKRLAELDQSNPNVFNELGDIYLKTGSKTEAYESFSHAIDSYTRVSLHNNAVAVCKKVLRLIPARYEVLIKLGLIRKKQGLAKEAESYYLSYLEKVLTDQQIGPDDVRKNCDEICDEMGDSPAVMEKVYDCIVRFNLKDDVARVLQKMYAAYSDAGDEEAMENTRRRMEEFGETPAEPPPAQPQPVDAAGEGTVITEDNIWNESHSEGERIQVDSSPAATPQPAVSDGPGAGKPVHEYGDIEIAASDASVAPGDPGGTAPKTNAPAGVAVEVEEHPEPAAPVETPAAEETAQEKVFDIAAEDDSPQPAAGPGAPDTGTEPAPASGSHTDIQVSAILGDDEDGGSTEEDYRSHYDLGMAYFEMDLLAEAIREYQFASKSPSFQARALEMIGLCFLKQNQAGLAIKQLTKGLQVVGDAGTEALGIKYNLGLAYEMAGDLDKARSAFEDVYVEDVTFREVAKKIEQFS